MSEARFDLVILHHTSEKTVENLVKELLVLLDKVGDSYLEYKLSEALLFEQSSSAIMDDISEEKGKVIQTQFRNLNVETELRPTLQLQAKPEPATDENAQQYICPSCEHSQPKQTDETVMDTCNMCGLVGAKLSQHHKKEAIYQAEKRKLEQLKTQKIKEALDRTRYEEEETLRNEARERLGIKDKNRTANIAVGVAVVSAMGVASYFIADTLRNSGHEEATEKAIAVEETTNKARKPSVTIQDENRSIAINQAVASGNGGAKGITGTSTKGQTEAQRLLVDASTPPDELETLKAILGSNKTLPENFLIQSDTTQFQAHQDRLKRLLALGKPGLALVFAESIDDPYPASLLVLEVAKHEADRQNTTLYNDILLAMKNLSTLGDSAQSSAMLKASLSQAYSFTGDKVSSLALLEKSIQQLDSEKITSKQRCQALIQIETDHRKFDNQAGAKRVAQAMKQYVETLPAEEYSHINHVYTHLAAVSFAGKNPEDANKWLHKIPASDARQFLLTQLETMKNK